MKLNIRIQRFESSFFFAKVNRGYWDPRDSISSYLTLKHYCASKIYSTREIDGSSALIWPFSLQATQRSTASAVGSRDILTKIGASVLQISRARDRVRFGDACVHVDLIYMQMYIKDREMCMNHANSTIFSSAWNEMPPLWLFLV